MIGNPRSSVFAIRREAVLGTLIVPNAGSLFVPLRAGFSMTAEFETLENDELRGDIGAAKPFIGKESVAGEHPAYLKHSGVEGQEPEIGLLFESIFGSKTVNSVEYNLVGGSTTTVLNVDTGEGALFSVGQAVLVKDNTNGWAIRNIKSITGDALTLNFALSAAPASGVLLGEVIQYTPTATEPDTFSAWAYMGNGHSVQAASGCKVESLSIELPAAQYGTVSFTYQGLKYYFNPTVIGATNKYIDFTDDAGTFAAIIPEGVYRVPSDLASAIATAMNDVSTETYTCVFNNTTGKYTIATSTSSVLSLLWDTGTNATNTIATTIGFDDAANDTGATTYTSDDEKVYESAIAPSYDTSDNIVVKGADFYIGTQDMTLCQCATSATISIAKTLEDIDCICAETGTKTKIAVSREVTIEAEIIAEKHEQQLFEYLLNNTSVSAMINAGKKDGTGNWIAGQNINIYLGNATVTANSVGGDNVIVYNVTVTGFVTETLKDVYANFV